MFRDIRKSCFLPARLMALAVVFWALAGCAAVVSSMALIPVQLVSDAIIKSTQTGIDTATAAVRTVVEPNE